LVDSVKDYTRIQKTPRWSTVIVFNTMRLIKDFNYINVLERHAYQWTVVLAS